MPVKPAIDGTASGAAQASPASPAEPLPDVLQRSVRRVLAALFRVLLRHGFSYTAFDALARRLYVDVAMGEFGIPGKKPSVSRASILSGLTRKEVQRVLEEAAGERAAPDSSRHNRAGRVLAAWARDPDFLDADGHPRTLALQDEPGSFAELVRRHSGDMPVRAVLDELLRVGAAARTADGRVAYRQPMFLGRTSATDKLDLLGIDAADLIATIDHNVTHGDVDPRFQRKVMYRNMPSSVVDEFRKLSAAKGMAVLQDLDAWLAGQATRTGQGAPATPKVRLGLGIYYFEEGAGGPAVPGAGTRKAKK
jgi:Family of unknown function (DUF6502)